MEQMGAGHESVSGAKVCESITEDTDSRRLLSQAAKANRSSQELGRPFSRWDSQLKTPMLASAHETHRETIDESAQQRNLVNC